MDVTLSSGISLRPGLAEAIAWRFVAEWFSRHPDDLWLRHMTFPDEGDVLRVYVVNPTYQGHHADLPLSGREAVRVYTSEWQFEIPGLWERAFESEVGDVLDRLCVDLQLACRHPSAPTPSDRVLLYRVIAGMLGLTQFEREEWRCVSLVAGAVASGGLLLREDLLQAFPQVTVQAPRHAYPPGALQEEAFGYWVFTRDGQPQAMLTEGAVAHLPDGRTIAFGGLVEPSRRAGVPDRIAPAMAAIGVSFLP